MGNRAFFGEKFECEAAGIENHGLDDECGNAASFFAPFKIGIAISPNRVYNYMRKYLYWRLI